MAAAGITSLNRLLRADGTLSQREEKSPMSVSTSGSVLNLHLLIHANGFIQFQLAIIQYVYQYKKTPNSCFHALADQT
jgi:hypothetical protein